MKARESLLLEQLGKGRGRNAWAASYTAKQSSDGLWNKLGWSKQTYDKKIRRLVQANLLDLSPAEALPALVISSAKNNPTSLS